MSILDAFTHARDFRCLLGDLPTQVLPQLRMLLAIAHMALDGPADVEEWSLLWSQRQIPHDAVRNYLDAPEIRSRFDLLHPETPFYQVADLHTAKNEVFGLERLIADVPAGERFFTTRDGAGLDRISFSEAARWVIACHAFDVSGIKSGASDDPRVKGGKGYPIGTGQCGPLGGVYAEGRDLAETLLLNLIPLEQFRDHIDLERDLPVWQRPAHTGAEESVPAGAARPYGPLDLYTWQTRRIRLTFDAAGVTGVLICNGDKYTPQNRHRLEPMTAWRRSQTQEKALKQALVYMPRKHDPSRSLWRGLEALLPTAFRGSGPREALAPGLLTWLALAYDEGGLDGGYRMRLHAVGVEYGTQNSVVTEIVDDSLDVSLTVVAEADGPLRTTVLDAVRAAENATKAVANLAANVQRACSDSSDLIDTARGNARTLSYAELDGPFRRWLAGLGPTTDPADARREWEQAAMRITRRLGGGIVEEAGTRAWIGRVVDDRRIDSSIAERWFLAALREALPLAHIAAPEPTEAPT